MNIQNNQLQWFQYILMNYFKEKDGKAFTKMVNRDNGKVKNLILDFCNKKVLDMHDWKSFILIFYKTEYEKTYYKPIYVMKKVNRPLHLIPSPSFESSISQLSLVKKNKGSVFTKTQKKNKKGTEDDDNSEIDLNSINNSAVTGSTREISLNQDLEKIKTSRKKSLENGTRPLSPTTVIELGPQSETEHVYQKVLTYVRKKKIVAQFHCCSKPMLNRPHTEKIKIYLCITRKTIKNIPNYNTYEETICEFPQSVIIRSINIQDHSVTLNKSSKVLLKYIYATFAEPCMLQEKSTQDLETVYKKYNQLTRSSLSYFHTYYFGGYHFFHAYCKSLQKLSDEFEKTKKHFALQERKHNVNRRFTFNNILHSSLQNMPEELENLFYDIRHKKKIQNIEIYALECLPYISPVKEDLMNQLQRLINKLNWCRNHSESDLDIEISWLELDEYSKYSKDDLLQNTELLVKIEKKLEVWGRYITTLIARCRAKKPKGSGPYGEYEYWFKREDQLGPILLTFYGKPISRLVSQLKNCNSTEVNQFIARRLYLNKYYNTSRINKDYISICMCSLEKINTANDMKEIKLIIPEFWKKLRFLWLLSGYWAVKNNITGFIQRVQYLIAKKSIKVLEVNNFFMIPQRIAKKIALDVIETMELWKNSFYDVKAYIEMHQWEMRWEFPFYKIFNVTDYIAKLATDFCFLAESLRHYLDIFSDGFTKVVQDEIVIDAFAQRVKSLATPLKTADFNIYDPDNDVHWNLLMETFSRELNSIEIESTLIINQSFKKLRSSVNATNLLLKFKEVDKNNKCYILLMSKFELIIIQVLKEIKLISQLIMNGLPYSLSHKFFNSRNSATINWIREFYIFLQSRFVFLSNIVEIKMTNTFKRALACLYNVFDFYDICQLIIYFNWLNIEKYSIRNQLEKKVFNLSSIEPSISRLNEKNKISSNSSNCDSQSFILKELLIERGFLVTINFDFHLCGIIMEINHITKLGFKLPREFYSLALLKESLLDDIRKLNLIIEKYNSLMLHFRKEELSSLRIFFCDFEYILNKGLAYYSWHTIKTKNFCNQLTKKLDMANSLKEDVGNIMSSIENILRKIEYIDWFRFPENLKLINLEKLQDFFEELEIQRNGTLNEMLALFSAVTPLLKKLEALIFKEISGRNLYLHLFYKYFEEKILKTLLKNLLQNIKKFENFLLGNEPSKIQIILTTIPNVVFDFHINQCYYYFMNSLDQLLLRYKKIPRWHQASCLEVSHIYKYEYVLKKYNYLDDITKFKIVGEKLIAVRLTIFMIMNKIAEYLFCWQQFQNLWLYDKAISSDKFLDHSRQLIEYCDVSLLYYDHFICELNSCRNYVDLHCVRIQIKSAKTEILHHALEWKYILKHKLLKLSRKYFQKLNKKLLVIYCILTQNVHNLAEFQDILQNINISVDFGCQYGYMCHVSEIRYILARHGLKFSQKDCNLLDKIRYIGSLINKTSKYRRFLIEPEKKLYAKMSKNLITDFAADCNIFAEIYFDEGPGTVGENLELGILLMQKFKSKFDTYNNKKEVMIQGEQLFDHICVSYDFYEKAFEEFKSLEIVFELYVAYKEVQDDWGSISWIYLDSEKIIIGIDVFISRYNQLPINIKQLPVAEDLKKNMENFKSSVPLMVKLKNDALKKRHWEELMFKTGHFFEMSASKFTLNDLFLMNLHLHKEVVADIIGKAVRELNVEKSIMSINKFWSEQKFTWSINHQQHMVTEIENIIQNLEDYCVELQRMADSQFATPFLEEIKNWEEKLSTVYEVLTNWIVLQDNVLNLRQFFRDIQWQKHLSYVYKEFKLINDKYLKIMRRFITKPVIIRHCSSLGCLKELVFLSSRLEKCKSLLTEFLNSERSCFSRLYLLSDDEIFPILVVSNLVNIQGVLPKIFCNVSSLTVLFAKSKKLEYVTGMVSVEGEIICFKNHVQINKSVPIWMCSVIEEMKTTIKYKIKMTVYNYTTCIKSSRTDWIKKHAGVCTLLACKVWWTTEVEYMFDKIKKGDLKAMKRYIAKLKYRQDELFLQIQSPLDSIERIKFVNIFLLDFHAISVVDKVINESIMSKDDFEWDCQLRFYWTKTSGTLKIKQCSGVFEYGYEYMGLSNSLVITPLTERVFLGITQAFMHRSAAAVTGSTGSGKTTTVNELSKIFGILCIFVNCSSLMNYKSFNRIFTALCPEGLWGCFEDFTKINISVISMITNELSKIKCASISHRKSLSLTGHDINFESSTEIIIILNTMFSKSKDLPESIKLLFRPITCVLPNTEEICHAVLLSEGFSNAKVLSTKITRLYEMSVHLFKGNQSDFSLRNLKTFLLMCGNSKRNAPDMDESIVLMRAMRDMNLSKLSSDDERIFLRLIKDIFPNIECPPVVHSQLEEAVRQVWENMGYSFIEKMVVKVIQTYEITKMRQFAALVGPTGGGKTFIVNTLCSAQSLLGNNSKVIKIIPKAYSTAELYGHYSDVTTKWCDGLFTKIFRELNNCSEKNTSNYILFDGDIDNLWAENMNLLMDENKAFMLANCEKIHLLENCFLLFEVGCLQNSSPRLASRVGVIYVDSQHLGYQPYWDRWVISRAEEKEIKLLKRYFEKYVPECLNLIIEGTDNVNSKTPLKTVIPQTSLNMVAQLCFILDILMPVVEKDINQGPNNEFSESVTIEDDTFEKELESVFILAIYSSLGICLDLKSKQIFDKFMKNVTNFKFVNDTRGNNAAYGTLPTRMSTLFEYNLDREQKCWLAWEDCVEPYIHNSFLSFDEIIVPTKDSCRMVWMMKLINHHNITDIRYKTLKYKSKSREKVRKPILLIGESSSMKTTILKEFARHLNINDYDQLNWNFSTITLASNIQAVLEEKLEEYTFVWEPKERKKLVVFIDDLNKSKNVQPFMENPSYFLKMILENNGMYTRDGNFTWKRIKHIYFYSAMNIGSRSVGCEDQRFLSLFYIYYLTEPSNEIITQIYTSIIGAHTNSFEDSIREIVPNLVVATLKIYEFTLSNLLPTPSKFHYIYDLRDLSQITKGILLTTPNIFKKPEQMLRIWRNEVTRVLWDRLISKDEQMIVQQHLKTTLEFFFPKSIDYVMQDPLLFGDYRNAMQPDNTRDYEDLLDYEAVYHLFTEILQDVNWDKSKSEIILFEGALDHLTQIHRILRLYRGHAVIIGPVGSGKETVTRLASFTAGCTISELRYTKKYNDLEFLSDIKMILRSIVLYDQKTTLMITDHHITKKGFLEIISNIMSSDEPLSIFNNKEKTAIISEIQKNKTNFPEHARNVDIWKQLEVKCKGFFHIALLMTPSINFLRRKCYQCPGIINNATINWMNQWPSEALHAIGRRFIKEADKIPEKIKESLVDMFVYVHETAREYIQNAKDKYFLACITPKHYLDFIQIYIVLINRKYYQIVNKINILERAIRKVDEAIKDLKLLNAKIDLQKSTVEQKELICKNLLTEVSNASEKLSSLKQNLEEKSEYISFLSKELTQKEKEMQISIDKAMEGIFEAIDAIKMIDADVIKKISSQESPPETALIIFECILILQGKTLVNWNDAKYLLFETNFVSKLEEINLNEITIHQQKQVRGRLKRLDKIIESNPISETETLFLCFLKAVLDYYNVLRENRPKHDRAADLNAEINQAQDYINSINIEIEQLETEVSSLYTRKEAANVDKHKAESELKVNFELLNAANKLVDGLNFMHHKWKEELSILQLEKPKSIGNNLISASFLAYAGIFNYEGRIKLQKLWKDSLIKKKIPVSLTYRLEHELANSVMLSQWLAEGLSNNECSIQNAILFTYSTRTPLCIDPKEQALDWIIKKEIDNNLKIISYEDTDFNEQLKDGIKHKHPVLIKDIDHIDTQTLRIIEGVEGTNRFYMTTRNIHPNLNPVVFSRTLVIDFSINKMELEDQLLDIFFESEERDLWDKRKDAVINQFGIKKLSTKLEEYLLLNIGKTESALLELLENIENLLEINRQINEIQSKYEAIETSLLASCKKRSTFKPLAECGTVLYFVLSEMYQVNPMYEMSIQLFLYILKYSLKNISVILVKDSSLEEWIESLKKHLKKFFYEFQCRGILSRHQLLLSMKMAIAFDKYDGRISQNEIDFFINPNKEVRKPQMSSPVPWISEVKWNELLKLSSEFPNEFGDIINHITTNTEDWLKCLDLIKSNHVDFPSPYNKLMHFKKLMLSRCLNINSIHYYIKDYILETLGEEFSVQPLTKLEDAIDISSCRVPIIVIATSGANPFSNIMKLALKRNKKNKLLKITPAIKDKENRKSLLLEAFCKGQWIVYHDCHLVPEYVLEIDRFLQISAEIHPEFRLILITEFSNAFPSIILQSSIKVTTDSPEDFKTKLLDMYNLTADEHMSSCDHPTFKPLLYALTFFHCAVQERKKFGPIGWNTDYNFGSSDYNIAAQTIEIYLNKSVKKLKETIPWKTLRYIVGEIIYGGDMDDRYDRRIITTYMEEYFGDFSDSLSQTFSLCRDHNIQYNILPDGNIEDYMDRIKKLPQVKSSRVVGLPISSDLKYNLEAVNIIWKNLSVTQCLSETNSDSASEESVMTLSNEVLRILPPRFNIVAIKKSHTNSPIPTTVVLIQELEIINVLIETIFDTTTNLVKALTGKVKMDDELENMFLSFYKNELPTGWRMLTPETCKSLSEWIQQLLQRVDQYKKWILHETTLPVMWLSGLHKPRSFLMAIIQETSRQIGKPLENLILHTHIQYEYDLEKIQDPAPTGCFVKGLFLEGAAWDSKKKCLKSLQPNILSEPLPVTLILPMEKSLTKCQNSLKIPVYITRMRSSVSNGRVFEAELKISTHESLCILQGVCMLLNND